MHTHYARRCCSSVMAGMFRVLENGFQRLMKSHTPETESPKLRGELSSSYRSTDESDAEGWKKRWTYRTDVRSDNGARSHRHHGRYLEKRSGPLYEVRTR